MRWMSRQGRRQREVRRRLRELSGNWGNSGGGNVVFVPAKYAERAGLLLMNWTIYLGWTSHCDARPYTGWVMGYSERTLKQTAC